MFPLYTPENIKKPKLTLIISGGIKWKHCEKAWNKAFLIPIKKYIISKLFKILNHKGNIGEKKFRTEIITPFFVSFFSQLSVFFVFFPTIWVISMSLVVIKMFLYCSPGGKFFTPFFVKILSRIGITSRTVNIYIFTNSLYCWWNKFNNPKETCCR